MYNYCESHISVLHVDLKSKALNRSIVTVSKFLAVRARELVLAIPAVLHPIAQQLGVDAVIIRAPQVGLHVTHHCRHKGNLLQISKQD